MTSLRIDNQEKETRRYKGDEGVEMRAKVAIDGRDQEAEEITIRDEKVANERMLFQRPFLCYADIVMRCTDDATDL